MCLEVMLQTVYLTRSGCTYSEAFYTLKRSYVCQKNGLQELGKKLILVSVFVEAVLPYFKEKLEEKSGFVAKWTVRIINCMKFVYALQYLTQQNSRYYKPYLHAFSILIRRQNSFEQNIDNKKSLLWRLLSQYNIFLVYLFKVYCEWYFSQQKTQTKPQSDEIVQTPTFAKKYQMKKGMCPLCQNSVQNAAILTCSGYVFCYSCITQHVNEDGKCPVTRVPANTHRIRKIFP